MHVDRKQLDDPARRKQRQKAEGYVLFGGLGVLGSRKTHQATTILRQTQNDPEPGFLLGIIVRLTPTLLAQIKSKKAS